MKTSPYRFGLLACLLIGFSATASAADWTDGVFPVKNHDFGTCAVDWPLMDECDKELIDGFDLN